MARRPTGITQADPTQPPPTDDAGRPIDEHGLPLNGPARIAALAGKPDPRDAAAADPTPTDTAKDAADV